MITIQPSTSSGEGIQGETACGARIVITPDTPYIHYRDEILYFCGQDCKQMYDENPLNSCMAARLLASK
jgi:YHS domain-containing protein